MSTPSDDAASWRDRRGDAAREHAAALERQKEAESAEASARITEFVAAALADGPAPEALRARDYRGRRTYPTGLTGWYLRQNRSVGVDTDGKFYVLTVPGGLTARLRGQTPDPSPPPRILGKGGRDGESIDLVDALANVLARGTGGGTSGSGGTGGTDGRGGRGGSVG
ncbi:hypothetical protein GCM10025865_22830 [Paraoerskovia sediminicola]|uniref:Uncharacterized protein n=1 Tax=Paraoerskovia sediminicola TaxID=1138587 RepID=A0ABM8G481_9CELL|nr:hypothetical protein [Paraoerskovia sediminicola]BDZ42984.1 hypothetical protein GCM10025865_22830 [Paraoerskovia sediminicola]